MTFVPNFEDKRCFIACDQYKIDTGQCSCHNRIMNPEFFKENIFDLENNDDIPIIVTAIIKKEIFESYKAILNDGTKISIKEYDVLNKKLKDGEIVTGYISSEEKEIQYEDGTYSRDLSIEEWFNIDKIESKKEETLIDIVLNNGYIKHEYGYKKITEDNTHWITFFNKNKDIQMYAYGTEDEDMIDLYNTQILKDISEGELKTFIKVLVNNNL